MYTHQRVPKKCIHILRDVIYVKCVYIFLAPSVYIYTLIVKINCFSSQHEIVLLNVAL